MKHDEQYWLGKLEIAKKNQELWSMEVNALEFKFNADRHGYGFRPFCRHSAFGRLIKLRRKLHALRATKIPYYETMIRRDDPLYCLDESTGRFILVKIWEKDREKCL